MSLWSRLKMADTGMLAAFAFYAIVGIICFAILVVIDFRFVHIGIIGVLSLITAYGLFKKRSWSIWLVVILFFVATIFSVYTLYYIMFNDLIFGLSMIAYLILTWIFTAYTAAKRSKLES
jgi:hypothetical protein